MFTAGLLCDSGIENSRSCDMLVSVAVVVVSIVTELATTSTVSLRPPTVISSGTSTVRPTPTSSPCCSFGRKPWSSAFTA